MKRLMSYLRKRFYLRGTTALGLFNTVTAALFNRVLVKHIWLGEGRNWVAWSIRKGTDFPPTLHDCFEARGN